MSLELVHLDSVTPNTTIAALIYGARRPRGVTIVAGHGYSSSKHNLDPLCGFLASHGFTVVSIDFPGHKLGASTGRLESLEDCVRALSTAATYARTRFEGPVYALGHSMGAITALRLCARDPAIAGAVAIATGWGRVSAVTTLAERGVTDLRSAYVDGASLLEILHQAEASTPATLAALAGRPVLYVAADRDGMVTPQSVRELHDRAPEPKTFVTIESDHTFAGERSRSAVLQWLNALHPRLAAV